MKSGTLLWLWLGVAVAGPVAGFLLGPWLRRTLSRRAILVAGAVAILIVAMALTPVSLPGVLPDHLALAAAFLWFCLWLGMIRRWPLRAAVFGVPALFLLWGANNATMCFLVIAGSELTALPARTISIDCGRSAQVVRMQLYGWVAHSGYELSIHTRPGGGPLEIERDRRRFDDGEYPEADRFSARVMGDGDCTTVVSYDGQEVWRAR